MSAPRSPRPATQQQQQQQQQQQRQTVCWSSAGLPDTKCKDAQHRGINGDHTNGTIGIGIGNSNSNSNSDGNEPEMDDRGSDAPRTRSSRPLVFLSTAALRQSLRCTKRRLLQQILVKLNHAEASDDAEYLALRDRQRELLEHVATLSTHVKSFVTNLVALGHGSSRIGDASLQIAASRAQSMALAMGAIPRHSNNNSSSSSGGNQHQHQAELGRRASGGFGAPSFDSDFPKNMVKLEAHARELAGIVLSSVVGSLEKKLEAMLTLKREMDERENYKLDFDSALRKLRVAKQRGKAEAIVRRDVKLQAARNTLAAATDAIVKKLMYYESARPVLVYHELRQFRELQTRFFTLCSSSFEVREQLGMRDDDDDLHGGSTSTGIGSGFALTFRQVSPSVALKQ